MIHIFTLLVALFALFEARGEPISPSQYRDEVTSYSITLKQAQNSAVTAEQSYTLSKVARLPQLLASGIFSQRFRHFEGQKEWALSLEPRVVQTIYGGGVIAADIEGKRLLHEAAICTEMFTLLEVIYAADYAYWNYWAMDRYKRVMMEYVAIIESQTGAIERRYSEGYTSKGDLLMMQSRLAEAEFELISAEQNRFTSQHNLNTLRGVSPSDSVTLVGHSEELLRVPSRISVEELFDRRPDLAAALLDESYAAQQVKAVKGGYNPTLTGGVTGSLRSYTPNVSGDTYLDGSIYVELSLPIYHFGERRKATAIYKSAERSYALTTAALRDEIEQEESNAWVAIVESREKMLIATHSLDISSENLQISTYSYNEGLVSIVDLLQAQISWIQSYTNSITSEYDYQLSLAAYRKVIAKID